MEKALHIEIITPQKVIFSGDVTSFTAPGSEGIFQVLYNHAPMLSSLAIGVIKTMSLNAKELRFATSGGFAHVFQNKITVLVETAEEAESIDVARAQAALDRAEKRLKANDEKLNQERARLALMRAINRLRVAGAI